MSFEPGGIALAGDHAIVALGSVGGIAVLDLNTTANPQKVSESVIAPGNITAMAVSGSRAYVAGENGISTFDLKNPAELRFGGLPSELPVISSLAVDNNRLYGVSRVWSPMAEAYWSYSSSFFVINGSDSNFVITGSAGLAHTPQGIPGGDGGGNPEVLDDGFIRLSRQRLAVSGDYVYAADTYPVPIPCPSPRPCGENYRITSSIWVIDVSNPTNPQAVAQVSADDIAVATPTPFAEHYSFSIRVIENYICWVGSWGVQVFDITDPSQPLRVDAATIAGYAVAAQKAGNLPFTIQGNYAYIAHPEFGIEVFDIGNSEFLKVGGNSSFDRPAGIYVTDDRVFAVTEGRRLISLNRYRAARFEEIRIEQSGAITLRLVGPPGVVGRVQRSSDLANWTDWRSVTFSENPFEISDFAGASPHFYRVSPNLRVKP